MPDEGPRALVAKLRGGMRLTAVDAAARAVGLLAGMTLADARARVPELDVAAADPAADAGILARLADGCERWTPRAVEDPPDGLLLDISGCVHLHGGEEALLETVERRLGQAGFTARGAVADTPDAAHAIARFGPGGIVPAGRTAEAVRPLPVAALEQADAVTAALSRAGLKTIGAVADQPVAALAARFGQEFATRLRRVLGQEDARIAPRRPEPAAMAERHFPEPILRMQDVEAVLSLLAGEVAAGLAQRGQGARVIEAALFRSDGAVRRLEVGTSRPLRDPRAMMRLFAERIETLSEPVDAGFGFDVVRLSVPAAEAQADRQADFDGSLLAGEQMAGLVDRLTTRLGPGRVLQFRPSDTHDPDRAGLVVPHPGAGELPPRPLLLVDPPERIEVMAPGPDGMPESFQWRRKRCRVVRAEGPERIAPEWWRPGAASSGRDYFRAEDETGRRFWMFHEARGWFLHGLFP